MVVTVKYVFGLARGADGRDALRLELPPGATVFEALRQLGLSALELHAAVNGESAADGTVLRDGDEMVLIPSIQGGRYGRGGVVMGRVAVAASVVLGLGLAGSPIDPVAAQTRVVVPIVIQAPRAVPARSSAPSTSVLVTTRSGSSQPGTSSTHITVRDTTGAGRILGGSPPARTLATAPIGTSSVLVTTRSGSSQPGTSSTHITVRDTTGAGRILGGSSPAQTLATVPIGTSSVLMTADRSLAPNGTGASGRTRVTVEDGAQAGRVVGGPVSVSSQRTAGLGQATWIITSDAPIETPIVILGQ